MISNPSGETGTELRSRTVLLVEDEVLVRLAAADTLRSAGYTVLEAASAEEAKELLATFADIAVIFSDIQIQGHVDGEELARFVRETYPALGILLTSGTADRPAGGEAIAFVAKPYALEDVVKRIEALLK